MRTKPCTHLGLAAALLCAQPALAGSDAISAVIDLDPVLGKQVVVERDGRAYTLMDKAVTLEFIDPRKRGEMGRILDDPRFLPAEGETAHFWIVSTIDLPHGMQASETALCDWNGTKTLATCVIDCDGGRYELVADRAPSGPASYRLRLTAVRIAAEEGDCSGEGAPYDLKSTGAGPVSLPVTFSR